MSEPDPGRATADYAPGAEGPHRCDECGGTGTWPSRDRNMRRQFHYADCGQVQPHGDQPDNVSARTFTEFAVYDPDTDGYLLTSEDVTAAERCLTRMWDQRPNAVLTSRVVHTRGEVRYEDQVVVPWHTRCDWVSGLNDDGSTTKAWCSRHDHYEGVPVAAEFIRGASS